MENAKRVVDSVAEEISEDTYLNLMSQYRPAYRVARGEGYEEIDRRVRKEEYREVVEYAREQGLTNVQTQ